MKIAIDARIIYTSTGRYVERLLHHLQELDHDNEYIVLLLAKDFERWQPTATNFSKAIADYPPYTFAEQIRFAIQLYKLKADVVHFTMPNFPIFYFRPHVTTVHDLTLITFVNTRKLGFLKDLYKNKLKPFVFKIVIWFVVHGSREIITPTEYVKGEIVRRLRVKLWRITVTYESAELTVTGKKPYEALVDQKYVLYVGNAFPYKNLEQLIRSFSFIQTQGHKLVLVGKKDFFYEQLASFVDESGIEDILF
ncbi:MAG: glycosyltransferase, partial [Candidatus Saccharibacteria bacterium]